MVNLVRDQTIDIAPKFLKRKTIIKKLRQYADEQMERAGEDTLEKIAHYLSLPETLLPAEKLIPMKLANVRLLRLYNIEMSRSLAHELESGMWQNQQRAAYLLLLTYNHMLKYYVGVIAKTQAEFSPLGYRAMGQHLGQLCLLGHQPSFHQFTALYLNLCEQGYEFSYEKYQSQWFMMRLAENFCGYTPAPWPKAAFESELYNGILEHWQDDTPTTLQALLKKACNRHTYQSYLKNEDGEYDWGTFYSHLPIEILMVQRLRQWRGLSEVPVDHILMDAPFNTLPEPCIENVHHELAEKVLAKVHQDFPDFDTVIAEGMQRESVA